MSAKVRLRAGRLGSTAALALLLCLLAAATASAAPDYDGDGAVANDCQPLDPAVHPSAPDEPDLAFEDTNCDGIDGTESNAVFVAVSGSDAATGTKGNPKRTITNAIATAVPDKDVYIAGGTYTESVQAQDGVSLYGGYLPFTGQRSMDEDTIIQGARQALLANGADGVILQLLTLRGLPDGTRNAYGVRAINNSKLALRAVEVISQAATAAPAGSSPAQPAEPANADGTPGAPGTCAGGNGAKGEGGTPFGPPDGGDGGAGGQGSSDAGDPGVAGQNNPGSGGTAGAANGGNGGPGGLAAVGSSGGTGSHGTFTLANAGADWANGAAATSGGGGGFGTGGGGGGGGGGDTADVGPVNVTVRGGGGGGGGGGGVGGGGGGLGTNGAGSFAAYLEDSALVAADSSLTAGNGGAGGDGGNGAPGGPGGSGGAGGDGDNTPAGPFDCGTNEGGDGGIGRPGGPGGSGGDGGGGSGGPSAGVFRTGPAAAYASRNSTETADAAGLGGRLGGTGTRAPSGQAAAKLDAPSASSIANADFDGDGLFDANDTCPETARGTADANADGCPDRPPKLPDGDGDGIPDSADQCPSTPRGTDANEDGCPDPAPAGPGPSAGPAAGPAALAVVASTVTNRWAAFAKFTLVRALAAKNVPAGATVTVLCKAKPQKRCPYKSRKVTTTFARASLDLAKPFKRRRLPVKATIEVRITGAGFIGKAIKFTIRRRALPRVSTLCVPPGARSPSKCV